MKTNARKFCLGASLLLLAACAVDVEPAASLDGEPDEQSVAAVDQALTNSSVPLSIIVGDATYNGVTEWAWTRHGLQFGAHRRATRGVALIENHGNSTLTYSLELAVGCIGNPPLYQTWSQQTLAPGQSVAPELRCPGEAKYARTHVYSMKYSGGEIGYNGPPSENNDVPEFRVQDFYTDGVVTSAFAEGAQVTAEVKATSVRGTFLNRSNVRLSISNMQVRGRCVDSRGREVDVAVNFGGTVDPGVTVAREVSCPTGYEAWWAFNELVKGWYP